MSPAPSISTRRLTQEAGRFIRITQGSQSLQRGLAILRSFRVGGTVLTNAELAARTALPRPTVSRLTHSLVDAGFLAYDLEQKAYRLTAVFLSLAHSFRLGILGLEVALPLMKRVAREDSINVGLAVVDQLEIVYLDSVRESRRGIFRRISAGSRVPLELTSLGRAYLAGVAKTERQRLLGGIALKYGAKWPALHDEIRRAITSIAKLGYCHASWQSGMVALAAPLIAPDKSVYALNISFPFVGGDSDPLVKRYSRILLRLKEDIEKAWDAKYRGTPS